MPIAFKRTKFICKISEILTFKKYSKKFFCISELLTKSASINNIIGSGNFASSISTGFVREIGRF